MNQARFAQLNNAKPSVVLVHGAFADGSSWAGVIRHLEHDGYSATAVQIAENSLADDITTTQRVIDAQKGPVILVGHSYGGAVISGAAIGKPNVKALVYVSAFALDKGETLGGIQEKYAAPLLASSVVPDSAGYLYVDRPKFRQAFAADVDPETASVMAATQRPINSAIFGTPAPEPAWKNIPSWFLVGTKDNAINPDLLRFFAKRAKSTSVEFDGSHATLVSHPEAVVDLILEAAQVTGRDQVLATA